MNMFTSLLQFLEMNGPVSKRRKKYNFLLTCPLPSPDPTSVDNAPTPAVSVSGALLPYLGSLQKAPRPAPLQLPLRQQLFSVSMRFLYGTLCKNAGFIVAIKHFT